MKTLESRIFDLPIDIRKLLFIHFLIRMRDKNMDVIRLIYDDIPIRAFIIFKFEKRFWTMNNFDFSFDYDNALRLKIYTKELLLNWIKSNYFLSSG